MTKHYSPVHHGGLTNHLPMYQQALKALNSSDNLILERSETYIERVELKDLEASNARLTDFEKAYLTEVSNYRALLADKSVEEVLKEFLLGKEAAMASGLFHGMIRLAFAAKSGDIEELARALGYFEAIAEPMTIECGNVTSEPKESWNRLMAQRMTMAIDFTDSAITGKVAQILENRDLMDFVTEIEVVEDTEKRMAFIFANWYMKTRDFYVLHVLTGYQALVALKPYIGHFDQWLKAYWEMAQIFSLSTTERLPIIKISVSPWDEVMTEAKAMTDVHDVKLFYACRDFYDRYELKIFNKVAHILSHKYWGKGH